jgi:hypothetical protein
MSQRRRAGDQAELIRAWLAGYATAVNEVRALQRRSRGRRRSPPRASRSTSSGEGGGVDGRRSSPPQATP